MDINNSIIPADFANSYTKVSKWSRPGGTLAKVLTVVAGCGGVFALYKALPYILSMMTNAFSIACLAIGLYAIVSIVANKKFRRMISTCFFLLCQKITSLAIETDPISIIKRHTSELEDRLKKITESMGKFRGAIRTVEQDKLKSEKELQHELELLEGYKKKGLQADSAVHANQAVRLKSLISDYDSDLKKMNQYYSLLKDLEHWTQLHVIDEKNQCDILEKKYKRTRDLYNAFSGIMSVINSDTDDYDEYLMATDFMMEQINQQMGAIDDTLLNTDSIINDLAVSNSINLSKADDILNIYEKYGIDGLFMTEEQRKGLPQSASGTTPVGDLMTDSDRDLEYAAKRCEDILGDKASKKRYV